MKYLTMPAQALLVLASMSCAPSEQFLRLTSEGGDMTLMTRSASCCLIFIDSLRVDSSQYGLFGATFGADGFVEASSYWRIHSIDTMRQRITFSNCRDDTLSVVLGKDQIKYIILGDWGRQHTPRQMVNDIILFPMMVTGMFGLTAGMVSLPISSTPWQDDVGVIAGGLGCMGAAAGIGLLIGKPSEEILEREKYRIESLH